MVDMTGLKELMEIIRVGALAATYTSGFAILFESVDERGIPDPRIQLACLDASLVMRPIFRKFQSVLITSGTLSPIDMYPRLLDFQPVVMVSLALSMARAAICPMVVARGNDQVTISSKFEEREDPAVLRNYGNLLVSNTEHPILECPLMFTRLGGALWCSSRRRCLFLYVVRILGECGFGVVRIGDYRRGDEKQTFILWKFWRTRNRQRARFVSFLSVGWPLTFAFSSVSRSVWWRKRSRAIISFSSKGVGRNRLFWTLRPSGFSVWNSVYLHSI